jgi:hypothetical protein
MNLWAFRDALFDPSCAVPDDIRVRSGADANQRFSVHRNNALSALVDALATTFPVVQALVGEDFFRATASAFVRQSPPTSPVLAGYGGAFPSFLASFPPAQQIGYLADVAQLEWLYQSALYAAEASALSHEDLQGLAGHPAALAARHWPLHPSVGVLRSTHPVVSIWAAHQHDDNSETLHALSGIQHRPEAALIVRPDGWTVSVIRISAAEALFLGALQDGGSLPQAIALVSDSGQTLDLPFVLATLFKHGLLMNNTTHQ